MCLKINISSSYKNIFFLDNFSSTFFSGISSRILHRKIFIRQNHQNFHYDFFSSDFFPIVGQEFSPGSNGGTPRLQIGLGKKIQTIFDSSTFFFKLSKSKNVFQKNRLFCMNASIRWQFNEFSWFPVRENSLFTPALSEKGELTIPNFRNLDQPSTSINTLIPPPPSPQTIRPQSSSDSRLDFGYHLFSSSGACGSCVSNDMYLRKLLTPLSHKYLVHIDFVSNSPPSQLTH